jgi:anionic cell wall polymer biosynthesis LytR-Cps2A-Psr (LCP) family protein
MSNTKGKAGIFLLILIALFLAAGIIYVITFFRSDPIEESLSGDQVINTLFVIEDQGKPLCAYVLLYYPPTRRAAIFDIPGSLGLIIRGVNRVDRIDTLYDPQRISPYENEIKSLLGIENINYYIILSLENLGKITDLLEGVQVFIPIAVDAYNTPDTSLSLDELQDGHREASILFPSGIAMLDGDKAQTYITYELPEENSDMSVFRKQRFFLGLLKRLGEQNAVLGNPQISRLFQSLLRTNMNSRTRSRLFDAYTQIDTDRINIQSVGGNERDVSGQVLIIPYWDGDLIKDYVRQALNSMIRSAEGSFSDRVFTVEVLNGTMVTGLAGRTAELLRGFGYDIINIGNADRSDYQSTVIIDRSGYEDMARAFGEIINCRNIRLDTVPEDSELEMDIWNYEYRADFTLVLGRDFNERYVTN